MASTDCRHQSNDICRLILDTVPSLQYQYRLGSSATSQLAEEVGFEPTVVLPRLISSQLP